MSFWGLVLLLVIGGLAGENVRAQNGYSFFRNFSVEDYQGHNRNFDIACDTSGVVYVANFEGLIYYNGAKWQKLLTPGISRITHLTLDKNGEIWVGGHNYIGKIVSGANGTPGLRSYVSDVVSEGEALIGDIIGIETEGESMVYYTQDLRISIKGDSICSREPYVNNRFPIMISSVQAGPDIRVEADGGDGVKITDRRLGTSIRLTEDQGLCSNRVNKLVYDQHGSVWGATDNGLFQIDMPSFFSYYDIHNGLQGEIQSICRHKNSFYVGTSQGLFIYDPQSDYFELVSPEIRQTCWKLIVNSRQELFAVTSNGLFMVQGKKIRQLNGNNVFSLAFDPSDVTTYYTGEIDGIYRYHAGDRFKISNVEKVMNLLFAQGDLWAETLYGEIYHATANRSSVELQDTTKGLEHVERNKLFLEADTVYVLSPTGIGRWDTGQNKFIYPDHGLNQYINNRDDWWPGLAFVSQGRILFVGGDSKRVLATNGFEIDEAMSSKFRLLDNLSIRTIYWDRDSILWLGNDNRLIKVNLRNRDAVYEHLPEVHIRSVRVGTDSLYWGGDNSSLDQKETGVIPSFKSQSRNFTFEYSSGFVNAISPILYSFCLEGPTSQDWVDWSLETHQDFNNLSYGTYLFRVKAMDGFDRVSPEKTFTFIIEKPYYLRWYSLLFYLLVLAGLISLYAKWRNRKLLIEKLRLEQLVEQRTEQIRSQRDEIAEKSQKLETALAELKEAQDQLIQQEKVATVGKLTQGLIDRILNPLNYIINFSHLSTVLLKDMNEDLEDEKESVSEDNYEDMREILDMLGTHLAKIEEHGNSTSRILKAMEEMLSDHSCHYATTNINKLIRSNLDVLNAYYQKEIQEANIQVLFEEPDKQVEADVDPLQLGKVLMSMMQNGIYALRKKKNNGVVYDAVMRVSLLLEEHNVLIVLWDNGIGIESTILEKIFDPFFTTKTTSEAAGVGLYLSREIILNHNGKVEVHSVKDDYTEFIVIIPIHQSINTKSNE